MPVAIDTAAALSDKNGAPAPGQAPDIPEGRLAQ